MPKFTPALSLNEPDAALLDLLDLFERICLTAVELVAILSSSGWLIASLGRLLRSSGDLMTPLDAVCALAAAISFQLSSSRRGPRSRLIGCLLACFVALLGASICIAHFAEIYLGLRTVALATTNPCLLYTSRCV